MMRALLLLSLYSITACGVRGDLYLPEDTVSDPSARQESKEQESSAQNNKVDSSK